MEHPENNEEYKGLVVNKGIEQPSSVNPYLKRKPKKRQLSVAEFVEGIVKGDVTILSQAVTLVESVKPEHHGCRPGSDREMSALFRQFHPCRYQWSARCGKEYLD